MLSLSTIRIAVTALVLCCAQCAGSYSPQSCSHALSSIQGLQRPQENSKKVAEYHENQLVEPSQEQTRAQASSTQNEEAAPRSIAGGEAKYIQQPWGPRQQSPYNPPPPPGYGMPPPLYGPRMPVPNRPMYPPIPAATPNGNSANSGQCSEVNYLDVPASISRLAADIHTLNGDVLGAIRSIEIPIIGLFSLPMYIIQAAGASVDLVRSTSIDVSHLNMRCITENTGMQIIGAAQELRQGEMQLSSVIGLLSTKPLGGSDIKMLLDVADGVKSILSDIEGILPFHHKDQSADEGSSSSSDSGFDGFGPDSTSASAAKPTSDIITTTIGAGPSRHTIWIQPIITVMTSKELKTGRESVPKPSSSQHVKTSRAMSASRKVRRKITSDAQDDFDAIHKSSTSNSLSVPMATSKTCTERITLQHSHMTALYASIRP